MNISALKRASGRLTNALRKTCGRSPQALGLRLLAKCEREERRIRERVAKVQADRQRAYSLMGGRTAPRTVAAWPSPLATKGDA